MEVEGTILTNTNDNTNGGGENLDPNTQTNVDVNQNIGGDQGQQGQDNGQGDNNSSKPSEPIIPETYDFKEALGELTLDETVANEFSGVLKEAKLSQAQATAVTKYGLQYAQNAVNAYQQQQANTVMEQNNAWAEDAKTTFGAKFNDTVSQAGTAIEYLEKDIPELRQILNENGLGNRKEVIAMFAKIGKMVEEDSGRGHGEGSGAEKTVAEVMYPSMK